MPDNASNRSGGFGELRFVMDVIAIGIAEVRIVVEHRHQRTSRTMGSLYTMLSTAKDIE